MLPSVASATAVMQHATRKSSWQASSQAHVFSYHPLSPSTLAWTALPCKPNVTAVMVSKRLAGGVSPHERPKVQRYRNDTNYSLLDVLLF